MTSVDGASSSRKTRCPIIQRLSTHALRATIYSEAPLLWNRRMIRVNQMQHVSCQQDQPVAAHVKLLWLVCCCQDFPMPRQLMSGNVCKLADLPYTRRQFPSEKRKNVLPLKLSHDIGCRDVIERPAVGRADQLDRKATPPL